MHSLSGPRCEYPLYRAGAPFFSPSSGWHTINSQLPGNKRQGVASPPEVYNASDYLQGQYARPTCDGGCLSTGANLSGEVCCFIGQQRRSGVLFRASLRSFCRQHLKVKIMELGDFAEVSN